VSTRPVPPIDRQFWLAILVAAVIVIPRTALISRAHSHYWDDQFHLACGLSLLTRADFRINRNDPPLGQAVLALPLLVTGSVPKSPAAYPAVLFGHRLSPETLSLIIALWKSLLFLPFAALVFHWCRTLYGLRSAWLALILILFDPTIAGHIAPASLDVPAVETILLACFLNWRYFQHPTRPRLVLAALATALALLTKHTAILLPVIILAYGVAATLVRRPAELPLRKAARALANQLAGIALITIVAIWPLTLFDVSRPSRHGPLIRTQYTEDFSFGADVINQSLERPWPAGIYIGSIRSAQEHAKHGHPAYILGRRSETGWWWYYPVLATYKIPIPILALFILAIFSLRKVRHTWDELALLIPAIAYTLFLCLQSINIGFRHFLPAYVPMLMLAGRSVGQTFLSAQTPLQDSALRTQHSGVLLTTGSWLLTTLLILDGLRIHPDYLSYTNFPRKNTHLAVSDSNLDWGQSLKQVRQWIDHNQLLINNRPVHIAYFGDPDGDPIRHYLGHRAHALGLRPEERIPQTGLLITSPVHLAGVYGEHDPLELLRQAEQQGLVSHLAIIGHTMRVYDLDQFDRHR
jgi:hypothetical protein